MAHAIFELKRLACGYFSRIDNTNAVNSIAGEREDIFPNNGGFQNGTCHESKASFEADESISARPKKTISSTGMNYRRKSFILRG